MTSTIVGYFEDYTQARNAENDLKAAGFRDDISIVGKNVDGMHVADEGQDENWWDKVKDAFGFADERELGTYQEASRRGALLSVKVPDEQTDAVAAIIERHNPIDLDQRAATWGDTDTKKTLTGVGARSGVESEVNIPLAEEQLQVGKRAVQRGALRVHTYVTERPVEEQVTLREENAFVDRRPVNRAAVAGEAAFQERTIEVEEVGEEAVVAKQARVVEEVSIGKEQTARTETVRDTVRKTEVQVEREPATTTTTTTTPATRRS